MTYLLFIHDFIYLELKSILRNLILLLRNITLSGLMLNSHLINVSKVQTAYIKDQSPTLRFLCSRFRRPLGARGMLCQTPTLVVIMAYPLMLAHTLMNTCDPEPGHEDLDMSQILRPRLEAGFLRSNSTTMIPGLSEVVF